MFLVHAKTKLSMWPSYSSFCQRRRNDLTVGRYEDVIKIMKATICASSSSKTRDKSLEMLNWLPIAYINKRRLLVHCILNNKVLYPPFNLKLGNRSSGKGRVTD